MGKEQKIKVIRIITSIVLLMAAYIPAIPEEIHIGLCAIAYVIIGADIVCLCSLAQFVQRSVFR